MSNLKERKGDVRIWLTCIEPEEEGEKDLAEMQSRLQALREH